MTYFWSVWLDVESILARLRMKISRWYERASNSKDSQTNSIDECSDMSDEREVSVELSINKENESPKVTKIIREHSTYEKKNELLRNYPSDGPEILEVEFITLLFTLTLSFIICAALTYILVWVSLILLIFPQNTF